MTLSEKESFWLEIRKELNEKNLNKFTCNYVIACAIQDLHNFKSCEKNTLGFGESVIYLIGEIDGISCYVDPMINTNSLDIIHEKGSIKVKNPSFDFF